MISALEGMFPTHYWHAECTLCLAELGIGRAIPSLVTYLARRPLVEVVKGKGAGESLLIQQVFLLKYGMKFLIDGLRTSSSVATTTQNTSSVGQQHGATHSAWIHCRIL